MDISDTLIDLPPRRRRRVIWLSLAVLALAAAVFVIPTLWFKPWSINHFYMRVLLEQLLERPPPML